MVQEWRHTSTAVVFPQCAERAVRIAFAAWDSVCVLDPIEPPYALCTMSIKSAEAGHAMQKLVHRHCGNFGCEGDCDRTGIPFTLDISGAAVLLISPGVAPTHPLFEHSLRADELPANLAGVP